MYESRADHLSNYQRLQEISILIPILLKNRQKTVTNSCRNKLSSKAILTLSKTEFTVLRKKSGDEAFQVLFKFLRRG